MIPERGAIRECVKAPYGDRAILVLNETSMNSDNALLALN